VVLALVPFLLLSLSRLPFFLLPVFLDLPLFLFVFFLYLLVWIEETHTMEMYYYDNFDNLYIGVPRIINLLLSPFAISLLVYDILGILMWTRYRIKMRDLALKHA
jgi:hypothetical protein